MPQRTTPASCSTFANDFTPEANLAKFQMQLNQLQQLENKSLPITQSYLALAAAAANLANLNTIDGNIVLQQLNMLSSGSKNFLNMNGPTAQSGNSVHLIENGLQYAKNAPTMKLMGACKPLTEDNNMQNIGKRHNVALAPCQLDSIVKTSPKRYLQAAEAPRNLLAATPRRSNENIGNNINNVHNINVGVAAVSATTSGNCATANNGMYSGNIPFTPKLRKETITGIGISNTTTNNPLITSPNVTNSNVTINTASCTNINSNNASPFNRTDELLDWLPKSSKIEGLPSPLNLSNVNRQRDGTTTPWNLYEKTAFTRYSIGTAATPTTPIERHLTSAESDARRKLELENILARQQTSPPQFSLSSIHQQPQQPWNQDNRLLRGGPSCGASSQQSLPPSLPSSSQLPLTDSSNFNSGTINNFAIGNARFEVGGGTTSIGVPKTKEEAILYGEGLIEWLKECADPVVTRFKLMELQSLIYNLKHKKHNNCLKRKRK